MIRALITGLAGFVGTHLSQYLASNGWEVAGFDQRQSTLPMTFTGDICDQSALTSALAEAKPEVIYHLAGVLRPDRPEKFYTVHVLGTVTLFEAILEAGLKPVTLIASSSAVYGYGLGSRLITEQFKLRPVTHYAASKAAQEIVALRYFGAYNLPVVCARTFNLIGPRQSPDLACSGFARQIALAEQAKSDATILTGDLNARRDFVDVRDAVRAYEMITARGRPGQAYNVCSGKPVSIRDCLALMLGMSPLPLKTALDPSRLQENDVPLQIGSAKELQGCTGWKPEISLTQSLSDLLEDWRHRVKLGME